MARDTVHSVYGYSALAFNVRHQIICMCVCDCVCRQVYAKYRFLTLECTNYIWIFPATAHSQTKNRKKHSEFICEFVFDSVFCLLRFVSRLGYCLVAFEPEWHNLHQKMEGTKQKKNLSSSAESEKQRTERKKKIYFQPLMMGEKLLRCYRHIYLRISPLRKWAEEENPYRHTHDDDDNNNNTQSDIDKRINERIYSGFRINRHRHTTPYVHRCTAYNT